MRTTITTAAMMLTFALAGTAFAEEGLFSDVSANSVFGASPSPGSSSNTEEPIRVAGPATLSDLLTKAGLEPNELNTQVISVKIARGKRTFPVLLTFSEDRNTIRMAMMLNTLKDGQTLSADKLMALLDANREENGATFAYSVKRRRIELHHVLENRSITPEKLTRETSKMGDLAEKTQELWVIEEAAKETDESAATEETPSEPAPATTPPAKQSLSLVGKWSAATSSTTAFALQINADGTFNMVTVSSGKTAKSTGKYTLDGTTLTLLDDQGTRLAGKIEQSTDKQFKFSPLNAKNATAGVTFKRAS